MTCRHENAFPTIYYGKEGYMWCPDCGATRQISVVDGSNEFKYSEKKWLYPKGYVSVLKQMEKMG